MVRRASSRTLLSSVARQHVRVLAGLGEDVAERVHHQRVAGVARSGLGGRDHEDGVLDGPRTHERAPSARPSASRPPQAAGMTSTSAPRSTSSRASFREAEVVAGHQPDPEPGDVDDDGRERAGMQRVGLLVAEGVVEVDLPVRRGGGAAHQQRVVGPRRILGGLEHPGDHRGVVLGGDRREVGRGRRRRGLERPGLTSEPASPKSRAKASGSTTRSLSDGTRSCSCAPLPAGSSPDAAWTTVTDRVLTPTVSRTGPRVMLGLPMPGETGVMAIGAAFSAVVLAGGVATRLDGADKASVENCTAARCSPGHSMRCWTRPRSSWSATRCRPPP